MQRAKEAADQARAAVLSGVKDTDAAARFHGRAVDADAVTRNGFIPGMNEREPRVVGALFVSPLNGWTAPLVGTDAVIVAMVQAHQTPTEEDFRKQEPQVREALLGERRQLLYIEWMQDLRRRAKVKDFREQYFEV
jgi:hypothetical protein